ncbi:glycosyltransferase family 4 protein, partial [Nostoc sp. NIES-2111]
MQFESHAPLKHHRQQATDVTSAEKTGDIAAQKGGMTFGPLFSGRVLHVSRVGYLGGAERVLLTIATCSRQFGAEPVVVSPPGEVQDLARAEGLAACPISAAHLRVTSNPFLLVRYYLELRTVQKEVMALCRAQAVDVIHAHHPLGALYCKEAVRELGIPLVLHLHEGLPAKSLYLRALRQAARLASRVVSVSSVGLELLRLAGADASRAVVIRNGIDLAQVLNAAEPRAFEVRGEGPHVGVFGVVERRKGHHVLLRAAAEFLQREPNAQFW